jgi:hypothetical protein
MTCTPLTCTNVVGDTGIEPVTSSVSEIGMGSADVHWWVSVQFRGLRGWRRTPPNIDGHMLVGALSWRATVTRVWKLGL